MTSADRPDSIQAAEHLRAAEVGGLTVTSDPPGAVCEDYVHSVDELVVLVDGRIEIEMDGQTLTPEPGQEIFIPANTLHTVRNIGDITAHWLYGYQRQQT